MDSTHGIPAGIAVIGGGTDNRVLEVSLGGVIEWGLRSSGVLSIRLFWAAHTHVFPTGNFAATSTHADHETPQVFELGRTNESTLRFLDREASYTYL